VSVVVGHPAGTAFTRALLRGLVRADLLEAFFTTIAIPEAIVEGVPVPARLRAELRRRVYSGVPRSKIRTRMLREVIRVAAQRAGIRPLVDREGGWASIDCMNRVLARRVASYIRQGGGGARIAYAYEDAALEAFRAAGPQGLLKVYELPIAEWRTLHRILAEERELAPEWSDTLDGLKDLPAKLARKDEEIELAEHIIVPCTFAQEGLLREYASTATIHRIPYGAPPVVAAEPTSRRSNEPLRVVYVGQLTQRKGLSYLFDAVSRSGKMAELMLIGPRPMEPCRGLQHAIPGHTWIPALPHREALLRMIEHHVMVFPSLCEGFGLVILEAMAQGVPVITTTNTGGPDVIEDGVDGFIVPIRDSAAIAARLERLHQDEDYRMAMAHAARRKAAAFGWQRYERETSDLLRSLVS
jgi:glycosyltransferase involved in cell wall biosynthesis